MAIIPAVSNSSPASVQPVSWHVIIWVLLTLAISSMSQPAGRILHTPRKYRLYLCSSPLICATEALSLFSGLTFAYYMLDISLVDAARFVVRDRFYHISKEETEIAEWPERSSLQRWIFFIIGTLPAFIKLLSLSGLPWSKAWGLMFGFSYLVIEIVMMLAKYDGRKPPASSVEALGYSAARIELTINSELQSRVESVEFWNTGFGAVFFFMAIMAQNVLTGWTLYSLWQPVTKMQVDVPQGWYNLWEWLLVILLYGSIMLFFIWLSLTLINNIWRPVPRILSWTAIIRVFMTAFAFTAVNALGPQMGSKSNKGTASSWLGAQGLLFLALGIIHVIRCCILRLCKTAPRVGEWLLAGGTLEDARDKTVLLFEKKGGDDGPLFIACFLFHLCLTVMWYAVRYDPSGTVNPSWTGVFG